MILQGTVAAVGAQTSSNTVGSNPNVPAGKLGEALVAELHGKWYTAAVAGLLFTSSVAAVTVPVNASNLVSVFSLLNNNLSPKNLELVSFDAAAVLATTVVDGLALYYQASLGKGTAVPTSQTPIASQNCLLGGSTNSTGVALSAATHVGTPTLLTILNYWGAVTSTSANPIHADFDGKYILAAGSIVSAAMTTAASTASGITMDIVWAEWPI